MAGSEAKLQEAKLQEANQLMQQMLELIAASSAQRIKIKPSQISQLREVLRMIGNGNLIHTNNESSSTLFQEIKMYRDNLRKLQRAIPAAQVRLQMKLADLNRARSHKEAVSDWFRATQKTI